MGLEFNQKETLVSNYIADLIELVKKKNPGESEFHQTVVEIFESLGPVVEKHPEYRNHKILARMVEPERTIIFRVPWLDDKGEVQINRGYRVQFNSALGPYKGGLRFHPTVNLSILKFLGFEQIFKNSLTTLPLGGGKGGADFDPKGKSDNEVMRFCQSFMNELFRHIGPNTDVPAGDIGVGGREIGLLFGQYKKLRNEFSGVLTGKGISWGGSLIRPEATGYGITYFAAEMMAAKNQNLKGKICLVSGSGNVAQYTVDKLNQLGAKVVTVSDSDGFIYDESGIDEKKNEFIKDLKNNRRGRIKEYADKFKGAKFTPADSKSDYNELWKIKADCIFPCATQNEINGKDAKNLLAGGIKLVCEGSNMAATLDGARMFIEAGILFAPSKAANAGGVAVSGLEMAQNSMRLSWTRSEVDEKLHSIMKRVHKSCLEAAATYGTPGNYLNGANIAGFLKVANAMMEQGAV